MIDDLRGALERSYDRHVEELRRLVRVPSVSAQRRGLDEACGVVVEMLEARGLRVVVDGGDPPSGAPIVTAEGGRPDGPTLLFYEHYDVQPEDPLDAWTVPPFELTERDGRLYGRGAADTKGHIVCRLAAVDAVRDVLGDDPIRYRFVIEGEEEVGSPHLEPFVAAHAESLRADACLWESGSVDAAGRPVVAAGMKGVVAFELRCRVAGSDLHSGYGPVVDNPLYRLAAAIASLRDPDGRVTVDHFFDDVDEPSPVDEECLASQPDESRALAEAFGVSEFLGRASGAAFARRLQLEPCLNVNGIHGGYAGDGPKTVLPALASAKLDVRLVPRQSPERVLALVRAHLDARGFGDVELHPHEGEPAARTPVDDDFVRLVARTAELAFGRPAVVRPSMPGAGPGFAFVRHLGVPLATAGCSYPGSQVHAPDEHLRVGDFVDARLHSALVVAALGGLV